MAITSDLIGRFGGGGTEVHQIPVNFVSSSGHGMKHVVDVPVPDGKQARVMVVGTAGSTMGTDSSSWPSLIIGGQDIGSYYQSIGYITTVTGPTVVEVRRRSITSPYDPSFVGTVYWWEVSNE